MVTIEKWQGMNGLFPNNSFNWLNCQNGTDATNCGCCTEDNIVEVGKAIKEIDPTTLVIGYHHTYIGYPIYRNGQVLDSNPAWWLIRGLITSHDAVDVDCKVFKRFPRVVLLLLHILHV